MTEYDWLNNIFTYTWVKVRVCSWAFTVFYSPWIMLCIVIFLSCLPTINAPLTKCITKWSACGGLRRSWWLAPDPGCPLVGADEWGVPIAFQPTRMFKSLHACTGRLMMLWLAANMSANMHKPFNPEGFWLDAWWFGQVCPLQRSSGCLALYWGFDSEWSWGGELDVRLWGQAHFVAASLQSYHVKICKVHRLEGPWKRS